MVVLPGTALLKALALNLRSLSRDSLPTVSTPGSGWCPPLCGLWFAADRSRGCWREKSLLQETVPYPASTGSPCSSSRWPLHTKWVRHTEVGVSSYLSGDPFLVRPEMFERPSLNPWEIPEICEILINWAVLPACRTGKSTCSDMMIWSRVGAKLIIL